MSRLIVEKNGTPIVVTEEYQEIWENVESGNRPISDLMDYHPFEPDEDAHTVQIMCTFLIFSNEMVGARVDNYQYIFGDADCLDNLNEGGQLLVVSLDI